MEHQDRGCCTSTGSRIPIQRRKQSRPCLSLMKKQVGYAPWLCCCAGKVSCSALPCPALPCPALPCPALPGHCSCWVTEIVVETCITHSHPAVSALPPCPALGQGGKAVKPYSQPFFNSHGQNLPGLLFGCCSWHSSGGDVSSLLCRLDTGQF